jgi:hypothetical protein
MLLLLPCILLLLLVLPSQQPDSPGVQLLPAAGVAIRDS